MHAVKTEEGSAGDDGDGEAAGGATGEDEDGGKAGSRR
jgi:hypothetical protein